MATRAPRKPPATRKRKESKRARSKGRVAAKKKVDRPSREKSPRQIVEEYIAGVTSGQLTTGRLQKLAVKRHLGDLKNAAKRGFWFSEPHALEAIAFIETCCRHSKGQQFAG